MAALRQAESAPAERPFGRLDERPIVRPSLHDEVSARLRDLIVDGTLPAGERIAELEVARALGISRTPLREALKVLANEGLVDLLPGRGAVVRVVTPRDAQDMLELTGVLEAHAGRLAARLATDGEIEAIVELHRRMRAHFERRERPRYFELNQQVHDAIVRAAHNPTLASMHGMLRMRMRRIRYLGNQSPANWAAAMAEHDAFVAALVARDGERLGALLEAHMAATWPRVSSSVAVLGDTV